VEERNSVNKCRTVRNVKEEQRKCKTKEINKKGEEK
jgi:hypothetical protein